MQDLYHEAGVIPDIRIETLDYEDGTKLIDAKLTVEYEEEIKREVTVDV